MRKLILILSFLFVPTIAFADFVVNFTLINDSGKAATFNYAGVNKTVALDPESCCNSAQLSFLASDDKSYSNNYCITVPNTAYKSCFKTDQEKSAWCGSTQQGFTCTNGAKQGNITITYKGS